MSWWKRLVERWKKFLEDAAKENDQICKGQKPSCCTKETNKEEHIYLRNRKNGIRSS